MATVTGLSASRYYTDNPIWVDVNTTGDVITDVVNLNIYQNATLVFTAKYYTYNNLVSFDLSEIIKGLLPEPQHPTNATAGTIITTNSVTLTITLANFNQTKTFYRGGLVSNSSNVQVPNNAVLSESEKIPVWSGFPSAKYYINNSNIIFTDILLSTDIENRRVINCDSVFLRFLNSKGGYSYWLFEEWEIKDKYKQGKIIDRRGKDLDLGNKPEFELSLSTRVEERYLATMRALVQSSEIYVYRLDNLIQEFNPTFQQTYTWTPIYNAGGDVDWNAFDSVYEISFKADLRLKNNPSLNGTG